uniref:Uncharacterized protein n=1 Tax=Arcella intermedia TaxID=1963864 RepID=A0A6B2KWQ7_9EUKA
MVVPVGNIDFQKYDHYFNLLQQFNDFELRGITLDYNKKQPINILKKRDWKTASIYFDYVRFEGSSAEIWEELQYYRKYLGVIGIVDCKQWSDLKDATLSFKKKMESISFLNSVIGRLCIAFEPAEDQKDLDKAEIDSKVNFIMVPAQEESRLLFYLKTVLLDFSATLLTHLEYYLSIPDAPLLLTPQDTTQELIEGNKKQKQARYLKQQGDLCLLLGSPLDAMDYYAKALDQCKATQDLLWVAAASEGAASAKLITLYQSNPILKDKQGPEFQEIITRVNEAIDFYTKKNATDLQIDLTIKLARLYITTGDKLLSSSLIMKAYAEADEILSIQEKISLTSTIAMLYKEINMKRKFSFFLRETALLCKKIVLPQRTYHLLKMVAPYYQVHLPFSEIKAEDPTKKPRRRDNLFAAGVVWKFIHATLFDDLIDVASEMKDPKIPIQYLISYLSTLGRHLPIARQNDLATKLLEQTKRFPVMRATGSPGILTVSPVSTIAESNYGGLLIDLENQDAGGPSGPFLYRPKRIITPSGPETPVVKCSINTPVVVRLELFNHFYFPINLQQLELHPDATTKLSKSETLVNFTSKPIQHLVLESQARKQVDFTITFSTPESVCKSVVLSYRAFNCIHDQIVKFDTHIKVMDLLSVMKVKRVVDGGTKMKLFNGQETKVDYLFKNEGNDEIDWIEISAEEMYEKSEDTNNIFRKKHKMVFWDNDVVQKNLPLQTGREFLLSFHIFTHISCLSSKLVIRYGNKKNVKDYQRCLEIPLELNIQNGLRLLSFDLLECSAESLKRFKEFPPHDDIMMDGGVLDDSNEQPEFFLAVLDVLNQAQQPFHLECNKQNVNSFFHSKSFVTIEPNVVRRIVVAMQRFIIPQDKLPLLDNAQKKFLIKEKGLTEETYNLFRELEVYRLKLLEKLNVHWYSITENSKGVLRLDNLSLTESQLEIVKRPPILLKIVPRDVGNNVVAKSHSLLTLRTDIKIIDPSRASSELQVSLVPCRLLSSSSFTWINRITDVAIKEAPPSFVVSFHEKGDYQLLLHCKDTRKEKQYWSPVFSISVQ